MIRPATLMSFALALGLQVHHGADAGGQHHDAHDALGIHAPLTLGDPDFAWKTAGQLGELGGRAGMQAQFIADGRGGLDHVFCGAGSGEQ